MENFVTYGDCTLYPGPQLNMLLGPNGSGKSSLVAAIALGLGFPPALLGRSRDAADFIRYGHEQARLVLGLRVPNSDDDDKEDSKDLSYMDGEDYSGNNKDDDFRPFLNGTGVILIERRMSRQERKQGLVNQWRLNEQPATLTQVQSLCRRLRLQVDNLCQFLPQDRVSEFARLTPRELLLACERAAVLEPRQGDQGEVDHDRAGFKDHDGLDANIDSVNDETNEHYSKYAGFVENGSLLADHERLKEWRQEERRLEAELAAQQGEREDLLRTNEALGRNIQRHEQRQALLKQINLARRKLPWMLYQEARNAFLAAKEHTRLCREALEAKRAQLLPLQAELDLMEGEGEEKEEEEEEGKEGDGRKTKMGRGVGEGERGGRRESRASRSLSVQNIQSKPGQTQMERENLQAEMEELREGIREGRRALQQSQGELDRARQKLAALEAQQRTATTDKRAWQARLEQLTQQATEASEQADEARQALDTAESSQAQKHRQSQALQADLQGITDRLTRVTDAQSRRVEQIRRLSPDCFRAWRWLQEPGQSGLRERVMGPIGLLLSCPDARYAGALETLLPRHLLLSFVARDQAAMEAFLSVVEDRLGLRVNVHCLSPNGENEAEAGEEAGFTPAELASLGFDAVAADLIEAPAAVKAALRWQHTPVSLKPLPRPEQVEAELVRRLGQRGAESTARFVAGDRLFELRRSRYDAEGLVTRTQPLRTPTLLTATPGTGTDEIVELEGLLRAKREQLDALRVDVAGGVERLQRLRAAWQAASSLGEELGRERRTLRTQLNDLAHVEVALELQRLEVARLTDQLGGETQAWQQQEARLLAKLRERIREEAAMSLKAATGLLSQALAELPMLLTRRLEEEGKRVRRERLQEAVCLAQSLLRGQETALRQAEQAQEGAKQEAQRLLAEAQQDELDPVTQAALAELPEAVAELRQLIAQAEAQASLLLDSASMTIGQREQREFHQRREEVWLGV